MRDAGTSPGPLVTSEQESQWIPSLLRAGALAALPPPGGYSRVSSRGSRWPGSATLKPGDVTWSVESLGSKTTLDASSSIQARRAPERDKCVIGSS